MSTEKKKPIDHTGFQLDRKALNIDGGMVVNGIVDKIFSILDDLDLNHDQKSDIAEIAPYVIKGLPYIQALAPLINVDGVRAWLATHPEFFKDAKAALAQVDAAALVAAEATAKLAATK